MAKRPFFVIFSSKSVFYVLRYISKTKIALEKPIRYLESRQNYLSGSCHPFFKQTSSSPLKIHLKSANLLLWWVDDVMVSSGRQTISEFLIILYIRFTLICGQSTCGQSIGGQSIKGGHSIVLTLVCINNKIAMFFVCFLFFVFCLFVTNFEMNFDWRYDILYMEWRGINTGWI